MIGVELAPVDTWFFRDGTPFSAGEAPMGNVGGLFPPHPGTVVGALRAALAVNRGWDGRSRWPDDYRAVLGDGPDDLGQLSFDGPFLLRDGQPLFRAPRHLLGTGNPKEWAPRTFLRPGPPVTCDLGDAVRLPEVVAFTGDLHDLKPGDDQWLTPAGLSAVLRGSLPLPQDVVHAGQLWAMESRTGLELDRNTGTAVEHSLYSARHVRPARKISLGARINCLPAEWTAPFDRLLPLGGESRLAECREWDGDLQVDAPLAALLSSHQIAIIALSPLDVGEDVCMGDPALDGLADARVVSAVLDRPQRIGGWNSLARTPLPMRSVLAPGSVLFCKLEDPTELSGTAAAATGLVRLGQRQEWGFGLAALGVWPRTTEVKE